jgi:hypothetical protein
MALFNAIVAGVCGWRQRKRVANRFSDYVDPALVEYVMSHPEDFTAEQRETQIDFVVALLDDDDLSCLPRLLSDAIVALRNAHGHADLIGSLVFATFGTFPIREERTPDQRRQQAVAELQQRLGEHVRIVHGRGAALVGMAGDKERGYSYFGAGLRRFSEVVKILVSLSGGQTREFVEGRDGIGAAAE